MFGPVLMLAAATFDPGGASQIDHVAGSASATCLDGPAPFERCRRYDQSNLSSVATTSLHNGTRVARLGSFNLRIDVRTSRERQVSFRSGEPFLPIQDQQLISRVVDRVPFGVVLRSYGIGRLLTDVNAVISIAVAPDLFGNGVLALTVPSERIEAYRRPSFVRVLQAECSYLCAIIAGVQDVVFAIREGTAASAANEISTDRQSVSAKGPPSEAEMSVRSTARTVPLRTPAAPRVRPDASTVISVALSPVPVSPPVHMPVETVARPPVAKIYDLNPAARAFGGGWLVRGKAVVIAIDKFEASPSSDALPSEAGQDVELYIPLRDKVTLAAQRTLVTFTWSVRQENLADGQVELLVNGRRARAVIRASNGSMVAQRLPLAVPATSVRSGEGLSIKRGSKPDAARSGASISSAWMPWKSR